MGWIHYLAYQQSSQASLAGFASRDPKKRAGDWRGIQGNFGPPSEQISIDGLTVYASLEEALADPEIDLIDLCLPPDRHVDAVLKTLAAGKACLCEKPLTLNHADALRLLEADKEGKLMVAHVLAAMNEFQFLIEAKEDERYGPIRGGRFHRTIGPPDWVPDFYDVKKVGGPLIDLHVHDTHLIRLLFGMPADIHSTAIRKDGVPKRYESIFDYGGEFVVCAGGGVHDSPARPFAHGYEVMFENATVRFEFAGYEDGTMDSIPLTVMHRDGSIDRPDLGDGDPIKAFTRQMDGVVQGFNGERPQALDPQYAADAIKISEWIASAS
ncbi:MAG: Gfo/Idh/MocA family oxidoreductase [Planctomycetota bacterium]